MKKIRAIFVYVTYIFPVVFFSILTLVPASVSAFSGSGSGTAGDPYQITTVTQLQEMKNSLTSSYILVNDIDASATSSWNSGAGFEPVGTSAPQFTGNFDGNGHVISSLYINRPSTDYVGLFGFTAGASVVKNVGMENVNITGQSFVGSLAGIVESPATMSNCYSNGNVTGSGTRAGGLVGQSNKTLSDCYSLASVSGSDMVGGLAGRIYDTVSNCYSAGFVSGSSNVGGLIGNVGSGTVSNSFWDTQTSGQATSAGGTGKTTVEMKTEATFTGAGWNFTTIWNMISLKNFGYPFLINLGADDTFSSGSGTSGDPYIIINVNQLQNMKYYLSAYFALGNDIDASATSSWNSGAGFEPVGTSAIPFTGTFNGNSYKILNLCINRPSTSNVGLFGYTGTGSVVENVRLKNVSVIGGTSYIGGLVGYSWSGTVSNCYATGSVIGGSGVGCLLGFSESSTISNCYATGSSSGTNLVGGLFGMVQNTVTNCYAMGSVFGTSEVGGMIGRNYGTVSNCYATGSVTGGSYVGGLVGRPLAGSVSNSFYDSQTSGQSDNDGRGVPKTTAEMKTESTFTGAGWNFTTIWDMAVLKNCGYPFLTSLGAEDAFASGSGTSGDPYIIINVNQLQNMKYYLSASFALGNDIDASATSGWNSGAGFEPIGTSATPFTGTFNGAGYKILNLYINRPSTSYVGLFGNIGSGVMIENVGLENENVRGQYRVGGLIGYSVAGSTVSNCYSAGSVNGNNGVGGLIGWNSGTISVCYSTVSVTCSEDNYFGGLVGLNTGGAISNSYATGSVNGNYVGGLVGRTEGGTISNCYSKGSVSGTTSVGGLVGSNSGGTVSNSFWDTQTSGQATSAGGTGKTTAEMKTESTFTGAGWNFTTIWDIVPYRNFGYPFLTSLGADNIFTSGSGTSGEPYIITNVNQLQNMKYYLSASFALGNDIDASATSGWNSGAGFEPVIIDNKNIFHNESGSLRGKSNERRITN